MIHNDDSSGIPTEQPGALPFQSWSIGILSRGNLHDAFWGLASNLAAVIGGAATIKLITSLVTPSEYGRATLVLGIVGFISFLTINPLFTAHMREYYDHLKSGSAHQYLTRLRVLFLVASGLSACCYLLFSFAGWMAGRGEYLWLAAPAILLLLMQPVLTATVSLLEAHRKFRAMAGVSICTKLGQVPVLAILLYAGIKGSNSIVLAQAVVLAPVLLLLYREFEQTRLASVASEPLQFQSTQKFLADAIKTVGLSLFFANLSGWVFTTSDRYLLQHYRSASDVGIYVANYGLWSIPYTILNAWIETVSRPRLYAAAASQNIRRVRYISVLRAAAGGGIAVAGTVMLFWVGKPIARIFLGDRYWFSTNLMLLIATAHIIFVVGSGMVSILIAQKRLTTLLWVTAAAATSNVALNTWLLPRYGLIGGGWSTLGSYLLWGILLAIVISTKPWPSKT